MKFVNPTPDTVWPAVDKKLDELGWRLRYGDLEGAKRSHDEACAAEVVSAYRALVMLPARRRNEVIRALRKAAQ